MKKLLLLGAVLTSVLAPITQAATTFKIATAYPNGTFPLIQLHNAAADIKEQTQGRVKIKIYPGGVKGGNDSVLGQIRKGLLSGALIEGAALAPSFTDLQVYYAPMFFKNYDEVDAVREIMDPVIEAGLAENGWNVFGLIEGGFAYPMTNSPAASVADLQKQKLWLPSGDALVEKVASVMGISPVFMGISEVLTGLSTNSINAIVAPPVAAITLQWYSKVKYLTDVPFMYTYATLAISDKAFGKLSDEDKIIVRKILTKAVDLIDKDSRVGNVSAYEVLMNQGVEVVTPTAEQIIALADDAKRSTDQLIKAGEFSQEIFDQMKSIVDGQRAKVKADKEAKVKAKAAKALMNQGGEVVVPKAEKITALVAGVKPLADQKKSNAEEQRAE
ncbi:MAG: TRAP transporter substrate-binding protein DctP [Saccharospirillaceae bacterium]|nr:TRAP transporter substrate-binding protein DctP [Pseudomonadales bacterium]NRB81286.1 TRAP transporter substrate-binding protein DctP [Saccharospirillaceae bacterium]